MNPGFFLLLSPGGSISPSCLTVLRNKPWETLLEERDMEGDPKGRVLLSDTPRVPGTLVSLPIYKRSPLSGHILSTHCIPGSRECHGTWQRSPCSGGASRAQPIRRLCRYCGQVSRPPVLRLCQRTLLSPTREAPHASFRQPQVLPSPGLGLRGRLLTWLSFVPGPCPHQALAAPAARPVARVGVTFLLAPHGIRPQLLSLAPGKAPRPSPSPAGITHPSQDPAVSWAALGVGCIQDFHFVSLLTSSGPHTAPQSVSVCRPHY